MTSAHIIPGLLLISLCFVGINAYVCVAIITMSLGFNGSACITNLQNAQDLAPAFAGTLYGIINFVGTTSGFISPVLVAHFTQHEVTYLINVKWTKFLHKMYFLEYFRTMAVCLLHWSSSIHYSCRILYTIR